ncbi:hypothetical protein JCM9140_822 [Halalkalibacter wakoensis JCM 9140]|uniref:Uncharacterized protein n=1 Tax=Halalkalibacter wakoensis JCM 9140 TaxID=1236970 RepID=W4PYQ3_9BACI|nr:hypothetical protein [Halalkalibacter wakoensis]GAE24862.1 hypothetical protein JCM9140_822 [Halalkalibacter wakoensis JCM 9140]
MQAQDFIKQTLQLHSISTIPSDLPYIMNVMNDIYEAEQFLRVDPDLHEEVPFVILDKDVIRHD